MIPFITRFDTVIVNLYPLLLPYSSNVTQPHFVVDDKIFFYHNQQSLLFQDLFQVWTGLSPKYHLPK